MFPIHNCITRCLTDPTGDDCSICYAIQVLVNYARSSKEAEEVSKEVDGFIYLICYCLVSLVIYNVL